jgi:hypothetical protein
MERWLMFALPMMAYSSSTIIICGRVAAGRGALGLGAGSSTCQTLRPHLKIPRRPRH